MTMGAPPILLPLGSGLGGTTLVNSGTCFRTPPRVLERWAREFGLELDESSLRPCYERVERALSVAEVTPELAGGNAAVARRGAERLGWSHGYLRRNARGCVGSGVYELAARPRQGHTGIPTFPRARAGARVITGADVRRILVDGGQARGVWAARPVAPRNGALRRSSPRPRARLGRRGRRRAWACPASCRGTTVSPTRTLDADVCVIGAGAGGAVAAAELAEGGARVVVLEQGSHHDPDDFTAQPMEMMARLYRDGGQTVTLGAPPIPLLLGRGLGGTTLVNSGTCFRTPAHILERWRREYGLELDGGVLDPCFERVERALSVAEVTPELAGANAAVARRGAERLGWSHGYLRRNARGCVGSGVCAFGCPTSAKQHTGITYLPRAQAAGATILTGADVQRIVVEDGRARGVRARLGTPDGARSGDGGGALGEREDRSGRSRVRGEWSWRSWRCAPPAWFWRPARSTPHRCWPAMGSGRLRVSSGATSCCTLPPPPLR